MSVQSSLSPRAVKAKRSVLRHLHVLGLLAYVSRQRSLVRPAPQPYRTLTYQERMTPQERHREADTERRYLEQFHAVRCPLCGGHLTAVQGHGGPAWHCACR